MTFAKNTIHRNLFGPSRAAAENVIAMILHTGIAVSVSRVSVLVWPKTNNWFPEVRGLARCERPAMAFWHVQLLGKLWYSDWHTTFDAANKRWLQCLMNGLPAPSYLYDTTNNAFPISNRVWGSAVEQWQPIGLGCRADTLRTSNVPMDRVKRGALTQGQAATWWCWSEQLPWLLCFCSLYREGKSDTYGWSDFHG